MINVDGNAHPGFLNAGHSWPQSIFLQITKKKPLYISSLKSMNKNDDKYSFYIILQKTLKNFLNRLSKIDLMRSESVLGQKIHRDEAHILELNN